MKTKEIEVWIGKSVLLDKTESFYQIVTNQKDAEAHRFTMIKARLIVEIPEQKIEITESQLEEAWNESPHTSPSFGAFDDFKKALGFKVGDE